MSPPLCRKFPRRYAGDDPALGYDWIAGLLDSDSYLGRHDDDDDFFRDIKEFRRVNRSECVQPTEALLVGGGGGRVVCMTYMYMYCTYIYMYMYVYNSGSLSFIFAFSK